MIAVSEAQSILSKETSLNIKQLKRTIKLNPTFRSSHDSIIKKKIHQTMQITALKAILARNINIQVKGAKIMKKLSL